ncbi:MAG: DUF1232 domain-containing protein [Hyphomicrobiales bacterium]|nr:DUF1232 domain-containing protein [Hyphomicrobiales bacterium]
MAKTQDGTYDPDEILGPEPIEARETRVKKGFWKTVRKAAGQIPFMEDVIAAYYCALDPQTPFSVRASLVGVLAYFVMPIDAVPDFIAGLGFTDDAAVLASALAMLSSHIKPVHRTAAKKALEPTDG